MSHTALWWFIKVDYWKLTKPEEEITNDGIYKVNSEGHGNVNLPRAERLDWEVYGERRLINWDNTSILKNKKIGY